MTDTTSSMPTSSPAIEVAVIPVAGLGTRWLPVTRSVPKELLPVWRQAAATYAVRECVAAGVREIVFVIAPGEDTVARHFERDDALMEVLEARGKADRIAELAALWDEITVHITTQPEPLGLGHAVHCARAEVDGRSFALLLPDEVLIAEPSATAQLIERGGDASIMLLEVDPERTDRYGIADLEDPNADVSRIRTMVEKPDPADAPSNKAIIGRYVLPASIFELLETQSAGRGGEIQLTDALARLAEQREVRGVLYRGVRHDVGQPPGLLVAAVDMALRDEEHGEWIRGQIEALLQGR